MNIAFIADRGEQHELTGLEARTYEPGCGRGHIWNPPDFQLWIFV